MLPGPCDSWAADAVLIRSVPTKFIELAAEVNSSMPFYTVNRIAEALNRQGKPLQGARVLVLGAAFKRDIDDPRNAPAVEVMKALLTRGAEVSYHDPYVPEVRLDGDHPACAVGGTADRPACAAAVAAGRDPGPFPARLLRSVPLTQATLASQD